MPDFDRYAYAKRCFTRFGLQEPTDEQCGILWDVVDYTPAGSFDDLANGLLRMSPKIQDAHQLIGVNKLLADRHG